MQKDNKQNFPFIFKILFIYFFGPIKPSTF